MSSLIDNAKCKQHEECPKDCDDINLIINSKQVNLGQISVRRMLPDAKCRMVGPWIFFDHLGPLHFAKGQGIDVRPHPHINLATVTYLFSGEITHKDSLGYEQIITPGAINLMVAGKGIVHSERTPQNLRQESHTAEGIQLWQALPKDLEEIDPAFYHYDKKSIPVCKTGDAKITMMIGNGWGMKSPVKTYCQTLYAQITLNKNAQLTLPNNIDEKAIYLLNGRVTNGNREINQHEMVIFNNNKDIIITANETSNIILIGGESLGTRHIWWNFVSSRKDRITQAQEDWQQGNFTMVEDDEEFIPLPST